MVKQKFCCRCIILFCKKNLCLLQPSKKTASRKKNNSSKGVSTSASPPEKINWVLSGPGGLIWSAFMDESIVPESEKQKWSETFITTLQDRNF